MHMEILCTLLLREDQKEVQLCDCVEMSCAKVGISCCKVLRLLCSDSYCTMSKQMVASVHHTLMKLLKMVLKRGFV